MKSPSSKDFSMGQIMSDISDDTTVPTPESLETDPETADFLNQIEFEEDAAHPVVVFPADTAHIQPDPYAQTEVMHRTSRETADIARDTAHMPKQDITPPPIQKNAA